MATVAFQFNIFIIQLWASDIPASIQLKLALEKVGYGFDLPLICRQKLSYSLFSLPCTQTIFIDAEHRMFSGQSALMWQKIICCDESLVHVCPSKATDRTLSLFDHLNKMWCGTRVKTQCMCVYMYRIYTAKTLTTYICLISTQKYLKGF